MSTRKWLHLLFKMSSSCFQFSFIPTWCYDVIHEKNGSWPMYFSFQQWLWNAFVYWFDDMRLAFKINAWSNEFGSDLTHPNVPSENKFQHFFSVFFFTRNLCKTPCKNECENRMLWEQSADRIHNRRSQGNGIQWNANANIAAYKCEKLVFTFEPTLD